MSEAIESEVAAAAVAHVEHVVALSHVDAVDMTSSIVSSFVSNNTIPATEVAGLINSTYNALTKLGETEAVKASTARSAPAVSVKKSVQSDGITCLECGKKLKMLKRHLATDHGLSVDEYRAKWNLPAEYPMVAPNYAQQRSELAMQIGLGRRPAAAPVEPVADAA